MSMVLMHLCAARRLTWLALAISLAESTCGAAAEETFAVLQTKTGSYTNVTVTSKAKEYIFILHSTGMGSIKIPELPDDIQEQLGYLVPAKAAAPAKSEKGLSVFARGLAGLQEKLKPLQQRLQSQSGGASETNIQFQLTPAMQIGVLAGIAVFFLFFGYCCHLICIKSQCTPSILAWVPGLQLIPLLRAADMSLWWFLAFFVPLLNVVAHILWSLNISRARGKTGWVALFLVLPITNLFAFLYLAFSSSAPAPQAPRYKSMALETA